MTKYSKRNPSPDTPRLPEDTSHLGGSASLGRAGRSVYSGPAITGKNPNALKGFDVSRQNIPAQIAALKKAIDKNLRRIAGLVRADDLDKAARVCMMTGRMVGTCNALAQLLNELPAETAPTEPKAAAKWFAEQESKRPVAPSRSQAKARKGHGSKPGFGTPGRAGKPWDVDK